MWQIIKMNKQTAYLSTALLVLMAMLSLSSCGAKAGAANTSANNQPQIIDVTTAQATVEQIPTYFEATGSLASDEATDVAPSVAGKVVEVNFDVGSFVEKGSVLVRLDDRDARIRLEQAQAAVEQQERAVEQAETGLRQAQARLGVTEGDGYNVENFSQVKTARANLNLAQIEFDHAQRLLESGDISRSIYDQRKATRDAMQGQLDEARQTGAVAAKAINAAQAQVASARAGVATANTQVDQARKGLADMAVLSPISGYVSERVADPGEYISPSVPNSKIATIVRTSTLRMNIDVPEQSIGKVATGQSIALQTSAYPDRNFAGTVTRISPSLNATARTLTVEADVPNTDGLLKPGQFATVRITQPQPESAVMVPAAAVRTEGDNNSIFVIKDGAAHQHLVQIGLLEGDVLQIKQGIAEGDVVATSNLNALSDGILVRAN